MLDPRSACSPRASFPVFVGIRAIAQATDGFPDDQAGVTVIAGWDPTKVGSEAKDYLFIRGR